MNAQNIRQRLEQLMVKCGFKLVTLSEDKLSHYYEIRHRGKLQMSVIRISNHCTNPSNWRDRYESNEPTLNLKNKILRRLNGDYSGLPNKYFKKFFYSLVVYDPKIDGKQQCGNVQEGGISVYQSTYDAAQMTNGILASLENKIQQIAHQGTIIENNKLRYKMKKRIRLTEGDLHRIVRKCVNESLNEISWQKVADAYGAAKDRETHFPSQYTDAQLTRRHRNDDGEFVREYDDEQYHTHNSRQYPQKFYKEAVRRLSQEIFGEDSIEDAISNAIGTERFQDVLSKVNEYQKNLEYINNNPTKFNWR